MNNLSKVSIVIPCRNEEKYIENCLQSITENDYPKDYLTVLVCDGLSDDNTPNLVHQFEQKYPYIKLLINNERTTPYALNLGINHERSDIVIILGAHSTVAPDFISQNVKILLQDDHIGCCGGYLSNSYENEISQVIGFAMSQKFGVGNASFRTSNKEGFVDTVAFGAYKREVFDKIGLFDTQLIRNQDDEFNYRLSKAGYKIYLSPKIKLNYIVRSSFKNLFRQYYQYGYWKVYVNKKHHKITSLRQLAPFCFILLMCLCLIAAPFSVYSIAIGLIILFLYLTLACYFAFSHNQFSFQQRLKIIYCFFILHASYGIGYGHGIWDFLICNKKPNSKYSTLTR